MKSIPRKMLVLLVALVLGAVGAFATFIKSISLISLLFIGAKLTTVCATLLLKLVFR